jgi:hypothetical protein
VNKTLSAERIYSLGDYQNIKFTDTITEIPEAIALNPTAVQMIRYLQIVDLEWSYINYMNLRAKQPKIIKPEDIEQALEFIEEERTRTFERLLNEISPNKAGKEELKNPDKIDPTIEEGD